ncbi:hypothetical protein BDZ91DRAFT_243174 [Kalaharituber pfeilii]|nr:hypothetical protein BDZ91DRAFT_243174 [Kalaharituber pfeilii]
MPISPSRVFIPGFTKNLLLKYDSHPLSDISGKFTNLSYPLAQRENTPKSHQVLLLHHCWISLSPRVGLLTCY